MTRYNYFVVYTYSSGVGNTVVPTASPICGIADIRKIETEIAKTFRTSPPSGLLDTLFSEEASKMGGVVCVTNFILFGTHEDDDND